MSQSPSSSNVTIVPLTDNVLKDIDSDPEAEQEAQDMELIIQQAWEKLRLVNEAWERCQEVQKKLEEEKKLLVAAMKLVTKEVVELVVDREWRILLQVSLQISSALD